MRNEWGMKNWGMEFYFFSILVFEDWTSALCLLTPLSYKLQPTAVGYHTPLQRWPALNGCGSLKIHHPEPCRTEDILPARHHSKPQQLLCTPSSLAHLSFSYSFIPNRGWNHITAGLQISLQFLASWEHGSFSSCLNQRRKKSLETCWFAWET